jgi:hypothetical protein
MEKEQQAENGSTKTPPPVASLMMSPKVDKIAPALIKVQEAINPITKNKTAAISQTRRYHYADLTSCLEEALPKLNANGICLTQTLWPDANGATKLWSILLHTSGQWIASQHPLIAKDTTSMQDIGSAETYARRYSICAQVGLALEDDDAAAASKPTQQSIAKPRADSRYANQR